MTDCDGKSVSNVQLSIPNYQRPYKWGDRNVSQLLDDIIEAKRIGKKNYRIGTLILHHQPESYDIVDGQQRIITFSLLLKALHVDCNFLEQELGDNDFNRRNISNNYKLLQRRIIQMTNNKEDETEKNSAKELASYVKEHCELVVVITSDLSEAFQFFDSQNARGKALYPHDLLKAYHLREMSDVPECETEQIVNEWEQIPQSRLAELLEYLYRIKQWLNGNDPDRLNEQNLHIFKGVTISMRTPYAQFYKAAYCYAKMVNASAMPFVTGCRKVTPFQFEAPIIAGKPFFEYTSHYYALLENIRGNDKKWYSCGRANEIMRAIECYNDSTGKIARLLFDSSLLLYEDKYCSATTPSEDELEHFEQFVVYAFVWAYSLRAQYKILSWVSATNYVMGKTKIINSFNLYKLIGECDTPATLLRVLSAKTFSLKRPDPQQADGDRSGFCVLHKPCQVLFEKYGFLTD